MDRAFVAASTPVWVETRAPVAGARGTAPWRRLLVAQDTGGGILGPVRGDIYWGADAEAAERAGRTGGPGRVWLLLPREVRPAAAPTRSSPRRERDRRHPLCGSRISRGTVAVGCFEPEREHRPAISHAARVA